MIKKYLKETVKYLLRSLFFTRKYVKDIEKMYGMSPSELKIRNEKRFLEIFRKAWNNSDYYRSLCISGEAVRKLN